MLFLKFRADIFSRRLNLTRIRFRYRHFKTSENVFFETLILKNTVVSRNHLTPELQLRLITPECKLWHCKNTEMEFPNDPFWGIYWPGGQALARYILDNKDLFCGKTVLDIGSGSGACALAAAKSGAKFVLANDTDPISLIAVHINSKLNGLTVHTDERDLIGEDVDSLIIKGNNNMTVKLDWDILLIGDMFYDTDFSVKLFIWLSELLKKNKLVFVGDPGRHALKELENINNFASLVKIANYKLCNGEHNGFSTSSVFKSIFTPFWGCFHAFHLATYMLTGICPQKVTVKSRKSIKIPVTFEEELSSMKILTRTPGRKIPAWRPFIKLHRLPSQSSSESVTRRRWMYRYWLYCYAHDSWPMATMLFDDDRADNLTFVRVTDSTFTQWKAFFCFKD